MIIIIVVNACVVIIVAIVNCVVIVIVFIISDVVTIVVAVVRNSMQYWLKSPEPLFIKSTLVLVVMQFSDGSRRAVFVAKAKKKKSRDQHPTREGSDGSRRAVFVAKTIKRKSGDQHPTAECSQDAKKSKIARGDPQPAIKRKRRNQHPTAEGSDDAKQRKIARGDPRPVAYSSRQQVQLNILQSLTAASGLTLPDSDDAHLTVDLLYQTIASEKRSIEVDVAGKTFASAIQLLKMLRAAVGAAKYGTTLTEEQFDTALQKLKTIFVDNFLHNERLAADLRLKTSDPDAFSRQGKSNLKSDRRGAFFAWLKSLTGDKAFAFAMLRHGNFDLRTLRKYAQALRQEAGDARSNSPDPELRRAAISARKQEKDAKRWQKWARQGWNCSPWQKKQICRLETGELAKEVRSANAAYGFGRGAEAPLSREHAMTLNVFSSQVLDDYMNQKT